MRKIRLLILCMICFVLAGCGAESGGNLVSTGIDLSSDTLKIDEISIVTSEVSEDYLWKIDWPNYYYTGDQNHIFKNGFRSISEEDRNFILQYLSEHDNMSPANGPFLCDIQVSTLDGNVHSGQSLRVYGQYPDGFDEFAAVINRVCGDDRVYLPVNGTRQEMTPEYFTIITGITDDDVAGGSVAEMIEHCNLVNDQTLYFSSAYELSKYAANYEICKMLEYYAESSPSTDEECLAYAEKLAAELGITGEITKDHSINEDQEWYEIPGFYGANIRVYRAETVTDDMSVETIDKYGNLKIFETTTTPSSECQGYRCLDFIYSNDLKFAVALDSNVTDIDLLIELAEIVKSIE